MSATNHTPPPAPRPPWADLSTDRERPTLAKVTWADGVRGGKTSTGMYYCNDRGIYDEWHDGIGRLDSIESVEVLHTHSPVTHVPVERALIERAVRMDRAGSAELYHDQFACLVPELIRDLAALADGAES